MDKFYVLFSCMRWTLVVLMSFCCAYAPLSAQDSVWAVNPHDYQYHMSVYACLQVDGETVTNQGRYELGAFVGDECRGVAVADACQGNSWLYLRVWSNKLSGEEVTFKVYDKESSKTIDVTETLVFENLGLVGEPSSPLQLVPRVFLPGDVNNDGVVAVNDVVLAINAVLGQAPDGFVHEAADMSGDGQIMVNDVVLMINVILGVKPSAATVRKFIDYGINGVSAPAQIMNMETE